MTAQYDLDRRLGAWFDAEAAAPPPPEPLRGVLDTTRRLRPWPAALAPIGSRWIDRAPGEPDSAGALRRLVVTALVALLALVLVGVALYVGSRLVAPRPTLPRDLAIDDLVSATGLSTPMASPFLVLLADGRVLVVDQAAFGSGNQLAKPELYDPATGSSLPIGPSGPVLRPSSATRLGDGRVLIIGDRGDSELFDPHSLLFSPAGAMVTPRSDAQATLLGTGDVLLVGGDQASAELFDPETLTFSATGSMAPTATQPISIATLLDGRVVVFVRIQVSPDASVIEAELYDPGTRAFSSAGRWPDFSVANSLVEANGRVVLIGSSRGSLAEPNGEAVVWDPATGGFGRLLPPSANIFTAAMLEDGRILSVGSVPYVRGARACVTPTVTHCSWAGIYDPALATTTELPPTAAWEPSLLRLLDGRVLVAGGLANGEIGPPAGNPAPAVATVQIYQ